MRSFWELAASVLFDDFKSFLWTFDDFKSFLWTAQHSLNDRPCRQCPFWVRDKADMTIALHMSASDPCPYYGRLRRFRFLTRKYLNTKRRIAEDRLSVLLVWFICLTSAGTVIFLYSAISNRPYQNSSSRETLVFKPSIEIERFITANFTLRFSWPATTNCRTLLSPMQRHGRSALAAIRS
jgi:hypothetical protein